MSAHPTPAAGVDVRHDRWKIRAWYERQPTVANWVGRIGLPLYVAVLVVGALGSRWPAGGALPTLEWREMRSPSDVLWSFAILSAVIALPAASFAPLGFLSVLALPRRRRRSKRYVFVAIPALIVSTLLAFLIQMLDAQFWNPPGASLAAAFAFCALGVFAGMRWLRGTVARLLLVPALALAAMMVPLAAAALTYTSLDLAPRVADGRTVNTRTMKQVMAKLAGRNPARLEPGTTATLQLMEREVNDLIAWGGSTSRLAPAVRMRFTDEDEATLEMSAPSPLAFLDARYLNVTAIGSLRVAAGDVTFRIRHLQVGSMVLPAFVTVPLSRELARLATGSDALRPFVAPIRELKVRRSAVTLTYGTAELPSGAVASLFEGGGSLATLREAAAAHVAHLRDDASQLPAGEEKFGAALESAFAFARQRSVGRNAADENEAAIVALGVAMGHWRLQRVIGIDADETAWHMSKLFRGATVRQREDWPKHFFVGAAMAVLSTQGISDAGGLLKEQLDADGGSGFSFGDLLADRAGASFAAAATADEAAARAMQDRLARGFRVDDFFPAAADLPENLTQMQFAARYGSVGSERFREVTDEIERRLEECAAYRGHVVPATYEGVGIN